jgi:hypothetical protein
MCQIHSSTVPTVSVYGECRTDTFYLLLLLSEFACVVLVQSPELKKLWRSSVKNDKDAQWLSEETCVVPHEQLRSLLEEVGMLVCWLTGTYRFMLTAQRLAPFPPPD